MVMEKLRDIRQTLKRELKTYQLVLRDVRTPKSARLLLSCAIGYALMPFDLIPDFIPIIGHLDDAIIVPSLIYFALKIVPPHVVDECRAKVTQ